MQRKTPKSKTPKTHSLIAEIDNQSDKETDNYFRVGILVVPSSRQVENAQLGDEVRTYRSVYMGEGKQRVKEG